MWNKREEDEFWKMTKTKTEVEEVYVSWWDGREGWIQEKSEKTR